MSQFFHISRCRLALKRAGVERMGTTYSKVYSKRDVYSTLREVVAYDKYFISEYSEHAPRPEHLIPAHSPNE